MFSADDVRLRWSQALVAAARDAWLEPNGRHPRSLRTYAESLDVLRRGYRRRFGRKS